MSIIFNNLPSYMGRNVELFCQQHPQYYYLFSSNESFYQKSLSVIENELSEDEGWQNLLISSYFNNIKYSLCLQIISELPLY